MERTSTFRLNFLRKKLLVSFMILWLFMGQSLLAHDVTGYTAGCVSGPKYSIDPTVRNVNSSSNYAWQYKSGSNWVCIVNGSNTINGNIYTVSGARSTGTDPSPIVFASPNAALDNIVIRCIIADGSNVNPCSTSATVYNAGTDSKNFIIDVTNTSCGSANVMSLGNRVWYDKDNTGTNNDEDGIADVVIHLYKDDNNDNNADGNIIATASTDDEGYYLFTNLAPGNYIVGAVPPAGYMRSTPYSDNPDNDINYDNNGFKAVSNEIRGNAITLVLGNEPNGNSNITYDFGFLPDCNCTTNSTNLLTNGSFEDGNTGWTATGGSLTTGTGYVACGAKNGFNNWSSGTSKVYQDVNVSPGAILTLKGFAGTHAAGIGCAPKLSLVFYNGSNQLSPQYDVVVDRNVDESYSQLEQYTITATVPSAATKVRVQSTITCNVMKLDAFCLTTTNTTVSLGSTVWYDTDNDGKLETGEAGIANATVHLYRASDTTAGAYIATATTSISGTYSFSGLAAGNYVVGVVTPTGYVSSAVNGGDPDNNIDNDDNGQVAQGNETRGLAISLSLNGEPEGNVNNTYDFGFLPDCSCTTSSNNLLTNGSFEDGNTGWTATGGSLTTGTGYVACGTKNGFNNWSSGTSNVYQDVNVNSGATITFKGFAGTHTAGIACSPKLSLVFYNGSTKLSPQYDVIVDRDVDKNNSQLKQYIITATVPATATKVRVQSTITCNVMKLDAFCLTTTCTTPATPVATKTDPTCAVATGTVVINNLPSGNWTINGTNNGTPFTLSGTGTSYTQNAVNPGTYVYTVTIAGGCTSAPVTTVINAQPATPTAPVAAISQFICGTNTTGTILLSGLPATGTWTLNLTGPGFSSANNTITGTGTTKSITGLAAGTYTFTVKNVAGCTSPVTTTVIGGPGRIGGTTWEDKNKNGRNDDGTNFLGGVVVKLYNADNNNVITGSVISTLTTPAGDGRYLFSNLCPGKYIVTFSDLNGYVRTLQLNQNVAELDNSDANQNTGYAPAINLAAGQLFGNIDAGYYTHTILPVTFSAITAQARNCEVNISFEVLTQKNTKQFEIEYSKDGANTWSNVGIVSAKNSSATAYKYSFTHTQPAIGVNLYRIKGVDADGKLTYSEVVSATSSCSGKGKINAYPNPAFEVLNVSLPSEYQDAQVQLFNGMGQLMVSDVRKSGLVRSLNTQNLTPGIYLLKVIHNNSVVMTQKVVKGE